MASALTLPVCEGMLSPRMAASKRNGAAGGRARARTTTFEQRQAIGERAGAATLAKYGREYYRSIRSRVKKAGK